MNPTDMLDFFNKEGTPVIDERDPLSKPESKFRPPSWPFVTPENGFDVIKALVLS